MIIYIDLIYIVLFWLNDDSLINDGFIYKKIWYNFVLGRKFFYWLDLRLFE